jgi:hypothetical protein
MPFPGMATDAPHKPEVCGLTGSKVLGSSLSFHEMI